MTDTMANGTTSNPRPPRWPTRAELDRRIDAVLARPPRCRLELARQLVAQAQRSPLPPTLAKLRRPSVPSELLH